MGKLGDEKFSADEFLTGLFEEKLVDSDKFDSEVVELLKKHLGQPKIARRAGNNLAEDLIDLADTRSQGGK